jgi:hypothetical protein
LRYSERHTLSTHVEEVEKSIGEQGRTQSLVETFTGQAARWWETHSPRLQTWTTVSTYFIERFGTRNYPKMQIFLHLNLATIQQSISNIAKVNGEELDTRMKGYGPTCSQVH